MMIHVCSSGDSTARLWTITNDGVTQEGDTVVLTHTPLQQSSSSSTTSNSSGGGNNNRDVTTVHWSVSCCCISVVFMFVHFSSPMDLR